MNRTIPVGSTPRITIDVVGGDLSIVGWEGQDLLIKGDEDEIRVHQDGEGVGVARGARTLNRRFHKPLLCH